MFTGYFFAVDHLCIFGGLTKQHFYGSLHVEAWCGRSATLSFAPPNMTFSFATTITVPHALPDPSTALLEQLLQDGFLRADLRIIPTMDRATFEQVVADAKHFAEEVGQAGEAWPVRCERWLQRLSSAITGKLFTELPPSERFAIAHAAITLAGRSELLR